MSSLRELYLDWPHEISIETFSKCNARCTFCTYPGLERIGEKMPDAMLDRIIEELKDHPRQFMVSPFKVNEPFLDKRLLPFCRKVMAQLPNANLRIFTNGSVLTEANIAGVASLERVVHLWVSLNDHRGQEYRELMGLDFERTAQGLDRLHRAVADGRFQHPVVVSKVRQQMALSEADRAFWDYVQERWPAFEIHLIKPDGWLGDIPLGSDEIPDAPCSRWFELSIMATGKVALCCMDGDGKYTIGDLGEQSLFEIYNGKAWRANRLKMWSRKQVHPCNTCSY